MTNEQLIAIEMKPLEGCAAVLVSFNRPFTHVEMNAMHHALNEHLIPHASEPCEPRHTLDCAMVKHPNCTQCDCGSSVDSTAGVKCVHCNGKGTKLQVFDAELFDGWSPEDDPCETCNGAGRITTVEQYLKTLPANWHEDSSLQTWFPLTGEEHERYKRCLYRANGRLIQLGQEPEKLDYPSTDKCGIAATSGDDVLTPDPTTRPECRTGGVSALPSAQGASRDASSGVFDIDLAHLESVRKTMADMKRHGSLQGIPMQEAEFLLSFIDNLWREYSRSQRTSEQRHE